MLFGDGEMSALMRSTDWSRTTLGPVSSWPASLRTSLGICLGSRFPIVLWWGPDLVMLYNEAYRGLIGNKHPRALGQAGRECWPEIWDIIGPMLGGVMEEGAATWSENLMLPLERRGYREECYFTFSYSPIRGDTGRVDGVFCAVKETTEQVIGERRLALLRALAASAEHAGGVEAACRRALEVTGEHPADVPFALVYLRGEGDTARLVASQGVPPGSPAAPPVVDLRGTSGEGWPMAEVAATEAVTTVEDLEARFRDVPPGPWPEAPRRALVLPLRPNAGSPSVGFLVVGASARRALDDQYRGFCELVAAQLSAAIGNASAYEQERQRAEALAELDRAKTTFFSNVSHEFRTPLTLMLGPIDDLLAAQAAGSPDRDTLTLVHRNGQRLLKLVNTLLDFSRIEAGRVRATCEPVDLPALTEGLAGTFRSAVEKAGLRLVVDCPPMTEPVFVDRDMWEKIVLNLLSNAFKFTFEGEIEVSLHARDGSAVLAVRDTGTGIAEAELPGLFNRFHRIHGARGRSSEGTGIGLALVQELARLHGGRVEAASTFGVGSTFTVRIPLGVGHLPSPPAAAAPRGDAAARHARPFVDEAVRWLPDAAADDPVAAVASHATIRDDAHTGAGGTVVVVDDNSDMRGYLRRLLSPTYRVVTAADGEEALGAMDPRPDLVIADVMMPRRDGFSLLAAIRVEPATASIPVILLSARAGEEARVEGLHAGADDYLVKPFSARELLARVDSHIKLSRLRREAAIALGESETRYRRLFETLIEGFCIAEVILDEAGAAVDYLLLEVNPAFERQSGLSNARGKRVRELAPDLEGHWFEVCGRVALTGEPARFVGPARSLNRWFDVSVYRVGGEGSRRVAILFTDVTESRQAEEALAAANAKLQDADRRKDEFLAMLAHELRNPLAVVSNATRVLRLAGLDEPNARRACEAMERQARHMERLIDDLLDVSRVTRGKVSLRNERVELLRIVEAAVESATGAIEATGHKLFVSVPREQLVVHGDTVRLTQVLANLLNNAAKYTPAGGEIHLSVERRGEEAEIRVRDNGVGMDPALVPRVFDLFVQGDRSPDRAQGGLGIGLTMARSLVELHGGRIEAASAGAGQGSEFTVSLPLAAVEASETQPAQALEEEVPPRRVLVVDDNADAAAMMRALLEIDGHQVTTANSGEAAVPIAIGRAPDVALIDLGMPGTDGFEVARRLQQEPGLAGTVLVALTGYGQEEDVQKSREAGFDHHLVKPADLGTLREILRAAGGATRRKAAAG